ncbi:MAG: hypothetical protein ACKVJC_06880, partial [Flavobacteriales bacterium]
GDTACELADLPYPVTFADESNLIFDLHPVQSFGAGTVFGDGTTFTPGQAFSALQDFSGGAMNFKSGMKFLAASQDFDEAGVDHDFSGKGMEFAINSDFAANEVFGEAGDFDAGVQLFDGANTFGKDSKFAASQSFGVAQTFTGENVFNAGTTFAPLQDFSTAGTSTSNAVTVGVLSTSAVDTVDEVLAAAVAINGFDGSANTGKFESGIITVIYSGNSAGDTYEEYAFADADLDGVIDAGELSNTNHDASTTFASGGTITFEQYDTQTFTGSQVFGDSIKFNANQKFSDDIQTFGTSTEFKGNADFKDEQNFAINTIFSDGQVFSETLDANNDAFIAAGITFGTDESIDFGATDVKFGESATFSKNQEFSTVHAASTASTTSNGGAVNNLDDMLAEAKTGAFDGSKDTGVAFATGQITATFTGIGAAEDSVQTYTFTDTNTNGIIDAGELSGAEFSTVTFTADTSTVVFDQHIDHDFSAVDMNFKEGTVFHPGEKFGKDVDFEGAIIFPDSIDMPTGAEFAPQTFADGATPAFDDFSTFADNTVFADSEIVFEENTHFEGATTFANDSTHTFKEGTVFDGALTLNVNTSITYDGDSIDFGPSSDLSAKVQNFAAGATPTIPQFGTGVTFADTQALPIGAVVSTGILLTAVECGTDTSSGTCLPNTDSAILTKGEIITPGESA